MSRRAAQQQLSASARTCALLLAAAIWLAVAPGAAAQPTTYTRVLAPGVTLRQTITQDPRPLVVTAIEADLQAPGVTLKCVPAQVRPNDNGPLRRRETASTLASRVGALVAVNGAYFTPAGDTVGLAVSDGELLSAPYPNRACAGWDASGRALMDVVTMQATVAAGGAVCQMSGINRQRKPGELVLYTPRFGATTNTDAAGSEAVITGVSLPFRPGRTIGTVSQVRSFAGACPIPSDGVVLSGSGPAGDFIRGLKVGDSVEISVSLRGASGTSWSAVRQAVCGGPFLVRDGKLLVDAAAERIAADVAIGRHPRTMLGVKPDGHVLLVAVDGRQSASAGLSLQEAAQLMMSLGATNAMNLDGGGSTSAAVRGIVVNSPSGGKERPVANCLTLWGQFQTPAEPPKLSITPTSATVESGQSLSFQLLGTGPDGQPLPIRPDDVVWGTQGGIGLADQGGRLTGIKAGRGQVVAWANGATATAEVTVVPGKPAIITGKAVPDPTSPQRFNVSITVTDANGNPIPGVTVAFTTDAGGQPAPATGTTDATGRAFTCVEWPANASAAHTVTASCPGIQPRAIVCAAPPSPATKASTSAMNQ